ncbi:MAG: ABC transporter ATP-binding protein/permease [Turicibacter sp.]|uniref:ABC transporter ATP-binding protein n=1 Tax=Turicibacter faecis TaxID=2963365 RepID=A0ABN6ZIG1_9FIRM|nr:ABC transporter ATP-binding protein/permease [Turicibacter sp. 1E2]MCI8702349.1 ABC transporter ATP-binding protein/permease [Turicibacter sp.]MCU7210044.1 ABC transporter ATP-binding protein/permease [Turicibacter sp. 1E2]BEH90723.1 putative ABC transporter ATP-binding protein [Turicibacter sp. TC023]
MMMNKRLIAMCDESKKYMGLTILCSWVGIVCNIVIVWLIGQLINRMVEGEALNMTGGSIGEALSSYPLIGPISLATGMIVVMIALVVKWVSHYLYGCYSYQASANARTTLRRLIYQKLLRLGMAYQQVEKTSGIVQLSIEGVEQLEIYFGKYIPQFFYSLLAPITLFVCLSFISFKAALVFMLGVPLIPLSIVAIMKVAKRILKAYWNNYANLGETFLENLQGLTTLKVYNQDERKHQEMNEEAEGFRQITMKVLSMQLNSINVMDLIAFGGSAIGTIVALYEFKRGMLQVGDLIVIILLSSEFFIPLRLLGSYFHIAMNGMAASDRIFALLDAPEEEEGALEMMPSSPQTVIQLSHLNFSYDGERQVLQDISLDLKSGGLTAIVGESGSGKSTIASLLLAQRRVANGSILINNLPLSDVRKEELYRYVSLVSAHSHIFKGTIRENLLMAREGVTTDEMMQALRTARLESFVMQLPQGLDTEVSDNGSSLSGGQKQRLALARVILADRPVIIFDEATSNIDVESEEAIWESIYELAKQKTVLVISHRLASVKEAKVIYVLNEGQLVESGTHHELMHRGGHYTRMVEKQHQLESMREVSR